MILSNVSSATLSGSNITMLLGACTLGGGAAGVGVATVTGALVEVDEDIAGVARFGADFGRDLLAAVRVLRRFTGALTGHCVH